MDSRTCRGAAASPRWRVSHAGVITRMEAFADTTIGKNGEGPHTPIETGDTPVTALHAVTPEAGYPRLNFRVQFSEGENQVINRARFRAPTGNLHRGPLRLARRHQRQVAGDVGGFGHGMN
jgi:hypothetical protein